MKLRYLFIALILLIFSQNFFAQESSKAVLVDEFGSTNCDDLSARIDALFVSVSNEPNSTGYVIIYGNEEKPLEKYWYEMEIKLLTKFRNFDANRIVFLHGSDEKDLKIQLWEVASGGDKPKFIEGNWDYTLPKKTKPFLLFKDSWINEMCHAEYDLKFYSKVLQADRQVKGNIVVYATSKDRFYRKRKDLLNVLVKQNNVLKSQLKFFYVQRKHSETAFWLVPHNTKQL